MRDHLLHVEKADKLDPLVSIALGIRLLAHKFTRLPKGRPKSARSVIAAYNSFAKEGDAYADKVFEIYNGAVKEKTR